MGCPGTDPEDDSLYRKFHPSVVSLAASPSARAARLGLPSPRSSGPLPLRCLLPPHRLVGGRQRVGSSQLLRTRVSPLCHTSKAHAVPPTPRFLVPRLLSLLTVLLKTAAFHPSISWPPPSLAPASEPALRFTSCLYCTSFSFTATAKCRPHAVLSGSLPLLLGMPLASPSQSPLTHLLCCLRVSF